MKYYIGNNLYIASNRHSDNIANKTIKHKQNIKLLD